MKRGQKSKVKGLFGSSEDDVKNHGNAEDWRCGVEGYHDGWYDADEVACQSHGGTGQYGGGEYLQVVAGIEHQTRYMGRGESEKCHGTAVGRCDGCQQTGGKEYHPSCAMDVDAQVVGIVVTQKQSIEGFYQGYRKKECQQ